MKIFCLVESLGAGGAERQLANLAVMLKGEGHEVCVCSFMPGDFYRPVLEKAGVPCTYVEPSLHRWLDDVHVVREIFRRKPDIVIAYLKKACCIACIARKIGGRFRLIVSERNTSTALGRDEKIRFRLFSNADFIVPNSYSQADFIRKYYPELTRKIQVIPNAVDLGHFHPAPGKASMHAVPEIMVAASVKPSKNTLVFIDAVRMLAERGAAFHVSWYGRDGGDTDYAALCETKINEYGLGKCIELKDKVADIAPRYRESDFLCLPSLFEGTPNAVCEALASGLPVLCSNVCDNPRYVRSGENGFLFDPSDAADIARKMGEALALSPEKYASACLRSRSVAEKYFEPELFRSNYLSLLE